MSEWLDIMLDEVKRKQREATAAADERNRRDQRRDQDRYDENSSGSADASAEESDSGKGAEL